MIFRFDLFRLELLQRESLRKILDVIQSENVGEIIVCAVELPYKFLVLVDDTVELLCSLEYQKRALPVCRNRNRSQNRNRNRICNRSHRMPVNAAHIVRNGLKAGGGAAIWPKSVLGDSMVKSSFLA